MLLGVSRPTNLLLPKERRFLAKKGSFKENRWTLSAEGDETKRKPNVQVRSR